MAQLPPFKGSVREGSWREAEPPTAPMPEAPRAEETRQVPRQKQELKPYNLAAYQKLPRLSSQEEVDALPAGTHLINAHSGDVYEKD